MRTASNTRCSFIDTIFEAERFACILYQMLRQDKTRSVAFPEVGVHLGHSGIFYNPALLHTLYSIPHGIDFFYRQHIFMLLILLLH